MNFTRSFWNLDISAGFFTKFNVQQHKNPLDCISLIEEVTQREGCENDFQSLLNVKSVCIQIVRLEKLVVLAEGKTCFGLGEYSDSVELNGNFMSMQQIIKKEKCQLLHLDEAKVKITLKWSLDLS